MTGDLGANLRIRRQKVSVESGQRPGIWTWSFNYTKLRGRGASATEKIIGADGIFEMRVIYQYETVRSSLLFQSKLDWARRDALLLEQCVKMSTWREAAFLINYTPRRFEAFDLDSAIGSEGIYKDSGGPDLAAFLVKSVLEGNLGDEALEYDASKRLLKWRSFQGELVATQFSIRHRFGIDVYPPATPPEPYREIKNNEVHDHRMAFSDAELLGIEHDHAINDIRRAKKNLSKIYHPDKSLHLNAEEQSIINLRIKEINNAADRLIERVRLRDGGRKPR